MKILSNDKITVQITDHGAELASIMANGNEYLWQGDIRFWGRRSPVLFPIVGRLWNNQYHHEGETYELGQHGFARDCEFQLTYEEENSLVFSLESNEDTLKLYPFPFILQIGYRLRDNRLQVIWNVENTGDREMHFQIGGHPAFYYRDLDLNTKQRGFLDFGQKHLLLHYLTPAEKGCVKPEHQELRLPDGIMELIANAILSELDTLTRSGIRMEFIGDLASLPQSLQESIRTAQAVHIPDDQLRMTLNVALNYSARWELTEATRQIAALVQNGTLAPQDITPDVISDHLATRGIPDPELLIRTSGEQRLSNFLLWQLSYTELYFTDTLWPEFGRDQMLAALREYGRRERRFGRL